MRNWVLGLLEKNKEIELAFVSTFSEQQQFTEAEVKKLIKNAIKAVAATKKSLDKTQIKKLTDLLNEVLSPVVQNYLANPMDESAFRNFHVIIEECMAYALGIKTDSTRINDFLKELLLRSKECIIDLSDINEWTKSVEYFVNEIPSTTNNYKLHYLLHVYNILLKSPKTNIQPILKRLIDQYSCFVAEKRADSWNYTMTMFEIVQSFELFGEYNHLFVPVRYNNEYNIKLIKGLLELQQDERAIGYCVKIIEHNIQRTLQPTLLAYT